MLKTYCRHAYTSKQTSARTNAHLMAATYFKNGPTSGTNLLKAPIYVEAPIYFKVPICFKVPIYFTVFASFSYFANSENHVRTQKLALTIKTQELQAVSSVHVVALDVHIGIQVLCFEPFGLF